jgi:O-antigen/teichoic acid export membrane protein
LSILIKNISSNYLAAVTAALAPLLAVQWYLDSIGAYKFGLISFITTLQVVLGLLDAGLSQALIREFSKSEGEKSEKVKILQAAEVGYIFIGLIGGLLLFCTSDLIVDRWLSPSAEHWRETLSAIQGAGLIFALGFPSSVYRSLLLGLQEQVKLNITLIAFTIIKTVGGVVVVAWTRSVVYYVIFQVVVTLIETCIRRVLALASVGIKGYRFRFVWRDIESLRKIALVMSLAALMGALTVQVDRLFLSGIGSLEIFGYYNVAANLAAGSLILLNPITQAYWPNAISCREDAASLKRICLEYLFCVCLLVIAGAIGYYFFGYLILSLLLGSKAAVDVVYSVLSILLMGTVLNAFYSVGYMAWIARGLTGKIFTVNLLSLGSAVIAIPLCIDRFGYIGAAAGWLIINLIGFLFSLDWLFLKRRI